MLNVAQHIEEYMITSDEIYEARQAVFDRVWEHFITNGAPLGLDGAGRCRYRGVDGSRCAVGLFIPDDRYEPYYDELYYAPAELDDRLALEPVASMAGTEFLCRLRDEHDAIDGTVSLAARLKALAVRYGLRTTHLEAASV